MNEQELKEKIIVAIESGLEKAGYVYTASQVDCVADALIAAGIGDVKETERKAFVYSEEIVHLDKKLKEAQHRAEVAERAVSRLVFYCECLPSNCSVYDETDCPYIGRASTDNCTKMHLLQAENAELTRKARQLELTLFLVVRNFKVLPVGLNLRKTQEEITDMTLETIEKIKQSIDYNSIENLFKEKKK